MKHYYTKKDFAYILPPERIRIHPLPERDTARLLVYKDNAITDGAFYELGAHLPEDALLVRNTTHVLPVRITTYTNGIPVEIFLLPDFSHTALSLETILAPNETPIRMHALIGNKKAVKDSTPITITRDSITLTIVPCIDSHEVLLSWSGPQPLSFIAMLDVIGETPLPPYLNRSAIPQDKDRYQSVFAKESGSVAAPTASLHFTPELIAKLHAQGTRIADITLHVGRGTFLPIKTATLDEHTMHAEYFSIPLETLLMLQRHTGPIIPVGTTSARTIESLASIARRITAGENETCWHVDKDTYITNPCTEHRKDILATLIKHMETTGALTLVGTTALFIRPGHRWTMVDALITNFHQSESTLIALVASLVGVDTWRTIYTHALEHDYAFLSYGDSSLLYPHNPHED